MKFGFYNDFRPCLLKDNGVVDFSNEVRSLQGGSPQVLLENIIVNYEFLRPRLQELEQEGRVIPLGEIRLRSPVPRPGKVLAGQGNYMEGVPITPPRPFFFFFKSPQAVIGPGDTIIFPDYQTVIFNHEAELGVVMGRAAHKLQIAEALDHVFGYTTAVDVSARAALEGHAALPGDGLAAVLYGKSFDTFLPLGPAIATSDSIRDPQNLHISYWVNGKLRQDYNTSDMEHSVAYMVATISQLMTLMPGDVIICGTKHAGLGPLQDGDLSEIEIEGIGRSSNTVSDPLKRKWSPDELRTAESMAESRERQKGMPHPGTWPFTPIGGA